jgi:flagellar biosynthesis protein FlhG
LANFDFDQAEGLRRMLAGPRPRIVTFLSVLRDAEKNAMLANLGASLVQAGSDVLLVDARSVSSGVASRFGVTRRATLLDVARQERALDEVIQPVSQGFGLVTLARGQQHAISQNVAEAQCLGNAFDVLARQTGVVLVDGELDANDAFPLAAMADGEIVIQVSSGAASMKSAYCLIKRLNACLGRRSFGVLVTGASEQEAYLVYENIARTASRYLAIQLNSMGSVPADEHLNRAARLGRSVIDAYPLAGASVAFRRLAGQFSLS